MGTYTAKRSNKFRGNYAQGRNVSEEEWDAIFGKKEEKSVQPPKPDTESTDK